MSTPIGSDFRGPGGRIGYLLRQAHQAMHGAIEREVRALGITASQFSLLSALRHAPGASVSELAENSMITQQTTSEIVRGLERKGLVERRPDDRDRRVGRLSLTAAGTAVLADADERVRRIEDLTVSAMTSDERADVAGWLVACAAILAERAPERRRPRRAASAQAPSGAGAPSA
jgi:DNA-binding MarR family transcriptional regulator